MIANDVKKYKCIIKDTYHNVIYEIYSNKKLTKKEMIKQVRYYQYEKKDELPDFDKNILIVSDD